MATRKISSEVKQRARRIRLLLMDVDGTLTNGMVCLQAFPDGSVADLKMFNAHDGAGVKLASIAGLRSGMITGRNSPATTQRAKEMGVEFVFQGQSRKLSAYEEIIKRAGVREEEVAYLGDDLPDLPLLRRAGLAIAVADAASEVKRVAHYITRAKGGAGAAREVVELILKVQGKWGAAIPKALA